MQYFFRRIRRSFRQIQLPGLYVRERKDFAGIGISGQAVFFIDHRFGNAGIMAIISGRRTEFRFQGGNIFFRRRYGFCRAYAASRCHDDMAAGDGNQRSG